MITGVQFRGTLAPNQTQRWFTYNWSAVQHVLWEVVPTPPGPAEPKSTGTSPSSGPTQHT